MKKRFNWGRVIEDFELGPYMIRSFHPRKVEGVMVTKEIDTDKIEYQGYVDGKDTNRSWTSLEEAMAGVIAYRALGPNSMDIASHFVAGVNALAKED